MPVSWRPEIRLPRIRGRHARLRTALFPLAVGADALLAAALAPECVVCGSVLERPTAGPACDACWAGVRRLTPPLCARCGHPLPTHSAELPPVLRSGVRGCLACGGWPPDLISRLGALGPYDGVLRALIHALKYGGRRTLAAGLAAALRTTAADVLANADALVPVPLHRVRQWQRGFNQAGLLARALGPAVWCVLRRVRDTRAQASLAGVARRRNVTGAFRLRTVPRVLRQARGRRLVLVDDVCTTGETLLACAAVLREAGAADVAALVAARTVLEHHGAEAAMPVSAGRAVR